MSQNYCKDCKSTSLGKPKLQQEAALLCTLCSLLTIPYSFPAVIPKSVCKLFIYFTVKFAIRFS